MPTLIYLLFFLTLGTAMGKENLFIASIYSGNNVLDPASIQTAGQYITLHQVLRPLTQLNKEGDIEGQLVSKWRIKNDFKEFTFTIAPDAKWSDGTRIKSIDIVKSLLRQKKLNTANHFNFSILDEVNTIDEDNFVITLKERNVNFIRQISYPEFGTVHLNDSGDISLTKTSGAYTVSELNEDSFTLKKNEHFPSHTKTSPEAIKIEWGNSDDKVKKATSKELDFFIPFSDMGKDRLKNVISDSYQVTYPHIGYSFWISINPKSEKLKDLSTRRMIQTAIKLNKPNFRELGPFWEDSQQLYLPDGLGRPSHSDINSIWKTITESSSKMPSFSSLKLSILIDEDFPFLEEIQGSLKKLGIELEVEKCLTGKEFFTKTKNREYDLVQTRNDFSSIDLHENLQTTFNPENPLIITSKEDNQFQRELSSALNITDNEKRHDVYKQIAKDILLKGYIAPVAYHKVIFIHKKNIDLSAWSTLFPEISFWKINIKR